MAVAKAEAFINRYGLNTRRSGYGPVEMLRTDCDHELMLQAVNRRISDGRVIWL
ncbi:MAG: hypothetical protein ACOX4G_10050 [Limnochordia bacterium]